MNSKQCSTVSLWSLFREGCWRAAPAAAEHRRGRGRGGGRGPGRSDRQWQGRRDRRGHRRRGGRPGRLQLEGREGRCAEVRRVLAGDRRGRNARRQPQGQYPQQCLVRYRQDPAQAGAAARAGFRGALAQSAPGAARQVVGHTDSTGAMAHNQTLSVNRAKSVTDYLARQGVPPAACRSRGAGRTIRSATMPPPRGARRTGGWRSTCTPSSNRRDRGPASEAAGAGPPP